MEIQIKILKKTGGQSYRLKLCFFFVVAKAVFTIWPTGFHPQKALQCTIICQKKMRRVQAGFAIFTNSNTTQKKHTRNGRRIKKTNT